MTKKANLDTPKWEQSIKRLRKNSWYSYNQAVTLYEEFHQTSMDSLIEEALSEQSDRVAEHELRIYDRIVDFREFLIDEGFKASTIQTHMTRIKSLYNKSRVRIPYIPQMDVINIKKSQPIGYDDLLTKEELVKAYDQFSSLKTKARFLAMVSGGLSNDECSNITTRQFIDDLYKYHQCDDDVDALKYLSESNNIIWVALLVRGKTAKPFYAVLSPECVQVTARAKLQEAQKGEIKEKLYGNKNYFTQKCTRINTHLKFGTAGDGKGRFRSHMIRKYHATTLADSHLSNQEIDELQGRGKTRVQEAYIKTNPNRQKILYARIINQVSLFHEYEYEILNEHDPAKMDVRLKVVNQKEKSKKLEIENRNLHKKLDSSEEIRKELENLMEDKGKDTILNIFAELLNDS